MHCKRKILDIIKEEKRMEKLDMEKLHIKINSQEFVQQVFNCPIIILGW